MNATNKAKKRKPHPGYVKLPQKRTIEVAPAWWTPQHLAKEVSRCRNHIRLRRRSSGVRLVELVRTGRNTLNELSREFGCSSNWIRKWVRQSDLDEGRREDGPSTDEREELRRVRRENRQLREEREILKKAAAWFARETGSIPPRSSNS